MITVKQGFNIEDYFDTEPEAESQEKLETGVDLSRISTEQIKKVLQVLFYALPINFKPK